MANAYTMPFIMERNLLVFLLGIIQVLTRQPIYAVLYGNSFRFVDAFKPCQGGGGCTVVLHYNTVECVLKDCHISYKNMAFQDRWCLVTGLVALKCRVFGQVYVVFQDR